MKSSNVQRAFSFLPVLYRLTSGISPSGIIFFALAVGFMQKVGDLTLGACDYCEGKGRSMHSVRYQSKELCLFHRAT